MPPFYSPMLGQRFPGVGYDGPPGPDPPGGEFLPVTDPNFSLNVGYAAGSGGGVESAFGSWDYTFGAIAPHALYYTTDVEPAILRLVINGSHAQGLFSALSITDDTESEDVYLSSAATHYESFGRTFWDWEPGAAPFADGETYTAVLEDP